MHYWDTAALVKLYALEPDSFRFADLAKSNAVILTSNFSLVELSCALLRKEAEKGLPASAADAYLRSFRNDCAIDRVRLIPYAAPAIQEAERLAKLAYGQPKPILIRSLDLIHTASASIAGASAIVMTNGSAISQSSWECKSCRLS